MSSRFLIFCFFLSCITLSQVECKSLVGDLIREIDEDGNTGTDEDFEGTGESFTDINNEDDNTAEDVTTEEDEEIRNIIRDSYDLINCITNEEPLCTFEDDIELIGWTPLKANGTVIQGNGHIILLDSFNKSDSGFVGIFSKISNVDIYDLKIEIVNHFEYTIKEGETFGFLAGEISDSAIIEKVSIIPQNITINSTTQSMVGLLAGLIASSSNSNNNNNEKVIIDRFSIPNYNNKYNHITFNGKYSQIGLLISESENIKIINSYISLNNVIINTESQSNNILFSMMITICSNCEIMNSYSRLSNLEINSNGVDVDIVGFIGKSEDNKITNSFIIFPKIYFNENIIKTSTLSLHTKNNIAGFLLDNRNTEMIGCYAIITLDTILYNRKNNNNNLPNVDFSGFTMIENGNSSYINCFIQIRGYTDVEFNSKSVFIKNIVSNENDEEETILLSQCLLELYNNEKEWKFIYSDDEINNNNNNNNTIRMIRMLSTDINKIEIENNTYIYGNINIDLYENITKLTTKDYESENIMNLPTSNIDGYWSYYRDPVTGEKRLRLSRLIFPIWYNSNKDEFIFSEPTVSHSIVKDSWDMNIWSIDSNGQIFNNGNLKFEIKKKTLFYKHKELCPNFCNNHGTCGNKGKCICYQGYTGIDCSLRVCPSSVVISKEIDSSSNVNTYPTECSSHGICNRQTGKCECEKGYEGYACHRINCPNDCKDVNGRCLRYETLKSYEKDQVRKEYIEKYGHWDVYQEYVCLPNSL